MLEKQKAVEGECHITTALFDNKYKLLHDRINIQAVSPITDKEYFVSGSTALLMLYVFSERIYKNSIKKVNEIREL